jgi:hypothetical protein
MRDLVTFYDIPNPQRGKVVACGRPGRRILCKLMVRFRTSTRDHNVWYVLRNNDCAAVLQYVRCLVWLCGER